MKKYKVGDIVWYAECEMKHLTKTCPICSGKKQVTLILGNNDAVILPCEYCGKGFQGPRGTIREYEYVSEPRQRKITRVDVKETAEGESRRYFSEPYHLDNEKIFDTEKEAQDKCEGIVKEEEKKQTTRAEHIKANTNKNYAWNAGYHLRNAIRDRKSAEYHDKMAIICKNRQRKVVIVK